MAPRNVEDIYGLTPMQRLMLVHELMRRDRRLLSNQVCYEIEGELRVDAFRDAWRQLVDRHAALRTAVLWEGLDQPVQVVRETVDLPFRVEDLGRLPEAERGLAVDAVVAADAAEPFQLGKAPLMRCTLVRLGGERHLLVWNIHHLVVDRWSHGTLFAELAAFYRAALNGTAPDLPPAPRFRDYVAWLRERDSGAAERFWQEELEGFRRSTPLATTSRTIFDGRRHTSARALAPDVAASIQAQATAGRTTPASVVLAGIGIALARRHRCTDVACGITVSGRPVGLDGVEHAVGSFVNNVPQRFRIEPDRPLHAWVREIQVGQLRRQPFEHESLASIRDWSALPPSEPLFDTLVVLNLDPPANPEWPGLRMTPGSATLDAGYPLVLGVTRDWGEGIRLDLVHDEDPDGASGLLDALAEGLRAVAGADGGTPAGALLSHAPSDVPDAAPAGDDADPVASRGALPAGTRDDAGAEGPPFDSEIGGPSSGPDQSGVRPHPGASGVGDVITGIWCEVLGLDSVSPDADFFALGGTSLQALRIFARVEQATGRSLPLSTLIEARTIRGMLEAVEGPSPPARDGPVIDLSPAGSAPPVFAVPGIGGNVLSLLAMAEEFGSERPLLGLESRGLDGEETRGSIEEIAADFVDAVSVREEGQLHLLGVCWGAAVAFEMARQLAARGTPPLSLSLLDPAFLLRSAEDAPAPSPRLEMVRERLGMYWDEFREGDWRSRRRLLAEKARVAARVVRGGGTTPDSEVELNQLRVRRANRDAVLRYDPKVLTIRGRVFLTGDRELGDAPDRRLEWLDLIDPEPDVVEIPGFDSGDAISQHVHEFVALLGAWLDGVEAST